MLKSSITTTRYNYTTTSYTSIYTYIKAINNNENKLKFLCTGEPAIRSRYARLTVLVPPEPPKILQGNFHSTTEDRIIKLECISVGGKPPAEVGNDYINIVIKLTLLAIE